MGDKSWCFTMAYNGIILKKIIRYVLQNLAKQYIKFWAFTSFSGCLNFSSTDFQHICGSHRTNCSKQHRIKLLQNSSEMGEIHLFLFGHLSVFVLFSYSMPLTLSNLYRFSTSQTGISEKLMANNFQNCIFNSSRLWYFAVLTLNPSCKVR